MEDVAGKWVDVDDFKDPEPEIPLTKFSGLEKNIVYRIDDIEGKNLMFGKTLMCKMTMKLANNETKQILTILPSTFKGSCNYHRVDIKKY